MIEMWQITVLILLPPVYVEAWSKLKEKGGGVRIRGPQRRKLQFSKRAGCSSNVTECNKDKHCT